MADLANQAGPVPRASWREIAEAARKPLILIGVTALYLGLFGLLAPDTPSSEGCYVGTDLGRITDYRLVAFPLTIAWGIVLFVIAWRWAAQRQERRGRPKRPAWPTLGLLLAYWALLLNVGLASNAIHTGGPIDFDAAGLLALLPALLVPVALLTEVAALLMGRFQPRDSWRMQIENATVFFAWSVLLTGFPLLIASVGAAGYGCD